MHRQVGSQYYMSRILNLTFDVHTLTCMAKKKLVSDYDQFFTLNMLNTCLGAINM